MILLDTHVLLWWQLDSERLSRPAAAGIRRANVGGAGVAIADCTLWEIALLLRLRRLKAEEPVLTVLERLSAGVRVIPVSPDIAATAAQFGTGYPRDPCDRLIGATAVSEGLTLVTRDDGIRASQMVRTLW